jgi:hypothetical protein
MEQLGLLGQSSSQPAEPGSVKAFPLPALPPGIRDRVRFPGEDNHQSLAQMAKTDLEAALQLLVDRAQYITGASGAAIALLTDDRMLCRASAGSSAPSIGTQLQMDSGLTGESVRLKKLLRCDDVETDPRVNRESCRALGIVSVVVFPLVCDEQVTGIFELLSGKAYAFEERDIHAVERLGEMIQTALEVEPDIPLRVPATSNTNSNSKDEISSGQKQNSAPSEKPAKFSSELNSHDIQPVAPINPGIVAQLHASVGKCASCGFPVSGGRKYCLDCESSASRQDASVGSMDAPDFLASYSNQKQKSWFSRNIYWIGIVLMSLATAAFLLLR